MKPKTDGSTDFVLSREEAESLKKLIQRQVDDPTFSPSGDTSDSDGKEILRKLSIALRGGDA